MAVMLHLIFRGLVWLCLLGAGLTAAVAPAFAEPGGMSRAQAFARAAALTALGRKMFLDPSLSASGKMACATCHDPRRAFGPPNVRAVQRGGKTMREPGIRAVPSLTYLQVVPQFTEHYYESDEEGDDSIDNGPTGGLTWDGRADRGRDQARVPLLSPFEMANDNAADFATRLRTTSYAGDVRAIFGDAVFDHPGRALAAAGTALEAYEQDYRSFYPYSSKYDAYLAGTAQLTAQEKRGLALFNDPDKGNCASCHISQRGNDGTPPQFTDYGLIALGVPRNPAIPANADPAFFDLGLCGPLRTDLRGRAEYCGLFRTPSLRNTARRNTFFHNGVFHTLKDVIEFYVERDTDPAKWYAKNADGSVRKFDDLPAAYHDNIAMDPPFGGKPGDKPALSGAEIDDVIAFLHTLNDGYVAGTPAAGGSNLVAAPVK